MFKKILVWLFVVVVGLMFILWSFSPLIVRTAVNSVLATNQIQLSDETQVRINPFAFVVEINDFSVVHKSTPLVELERLYMDIDPTRLLFNQVSVSRLELSGLAANVEQNQDKLYLSGVDVLALFANESAKQPTAEETTNADNESTNPEADSNKKAPYSLLVENIALADLDVTFKNSDANIQSKLQSLNVNQVKGDVDNLALDLDLLLSVSAAINDMSVESDVQLQTQVALLAQESATITISNTDFTLSDLKANAAGYHVEQEVLNLASDKIELVSNNQGPSINGNAAFKLGALHISPVDADNKPRVDKTLSLAEISIPSIVIKQNEVPEINIDTIDVSQLDLMAADSANSDAPSLLSMASLNINNVLVSQEQLAIALINLGKVDVNATVLSDKSLSPLFLAESQEADPETEASPNTQNENSTNETTSDEVNAQPKFAIKLDEFSLTEQIDVHFEDKSVAPQFKTHLYLNQISLTDIDSQNAEKVGKLVLRGGMDDYTKIKLDADLQPFLAQSKYAFKGDIKELSLPELSPYVDQALGYVIETGVLNNEFDVAIDGNIVDGESRSLLQSIDLTAVEQDGEKNAFSGGAVSLNMALNMLKDGDGNVELNIPISGDLNNPSIGVSGIVALIVKQATMSAAKDYLITTFLPYSQVVKIALSASDSLLKMSFEPMPYEQVNAPLNPSQKDYLGQLAEVLKTQSDIKIKICPIAAKNSEANGSRDEQLTQAKSSGARVKEYLVQQLGVKSERLFACAAALDEKGVSRIEFQQL